MRRSQSINQSITTYRVLNIAPPKQKFTEAPATSRHAQKAADLRLDLKPCPLMSPFFSSDGRSFHTDGADERKLR